MWLPLRDLRRPARGAPSGSATAALYDRLYPIYLATYQQLRPSFQALAGFRRDFPASAGPGR